MADKPMELTNDDIERILRLIEESAFDEIEIEWKGLRLRLSKGGGLSRGETAAADNRRSESTAIRSAGPVSTPPEKSDEKGKLSSQPTEIDLSGARESAVNHVPGIVEVRAVLMGTFYRSPEPGKPPFVEKGSVVAAGDTLCLLEVMKMFNGVQAQCAGRVVDIGPKDGQLVDYDELLFLIEPL